MKLLKFKYQKQKLTFWFLIITIIPLLATFGFAYFTMRSQIKNQEIEKLIAVRDLKVREINNWLENIETDIHILSRNSRIIDYWGTKNISTKVEENKKHEFYIKYVLDYWISDKKYAKEIFIVDIQNGEIIVSTNPVFLGKNTSNEEYFKKCKKGHDIYIKDIYKNQQNGIPEMLFAAPVFENDEVIAIIAVKINLNASLYELMLNRTGLGETGETLIVNRDVFTLSELRWYKDAPLNLIIEANPAVKSSQGITGIEKTKDYRGIDIYAAYTHIEKTNWGFVAKRDISELNKPINSLTISFLLILAISVVILVVISRIIAESIAKPITNISNVAREIQIGNYNLRTQIESDDEIGDLASSIDEMANTLNEQDNIQKGRQAISDALISIVQFEEFWETIGNKLVEVSDADICAFYIFNENESKFEHEFSIGLNSEMMKDFSLEAFEGEMGPVVTSGKLVHKKYTNKELATVIRTTSFDAVPEEMISFPIILENEIHAVISLAKRSSFSPEVVDIINQTSIIINTRFSNILSLTRTQSLAEELSYTNKNLKQQQQVTQSQNDELQRQRDELNSQAQELMRQNVELEKQRNQVEEANQMKSEFLSNMSHELRTPLNSVMALSRVLLMQSSKKLNKDEINYLEIIERNGKNLLRLINSILDLSKIEAGKTDLNISKFDINSSLEVIVENISQPAYDKGLEIKFELDDQLKLIESDEQKVTQIIQNIVGNAIKFTDKGFVKISSSLDEKHCRIAVSDTGIGISKSNLANIFEEFRQADGSASRKFEGSGLGLAISKQLTKLLKGEIFVNSKEHEGTRFDIVFPLEWPDKSQIKTEKLIDYKEVPKSTKTILVVDDEPKASKIIADNLEQSGYATYQINNSTEVVQNAKMLKPFAITLDLLMPEKDGYEVLQDLKNDPDTADIPVIIVSVSEDIDTALALGAVGYISKPVVKEDLLKEIKKISSKALNILLVDDDGFEREHVKNYLNDEQYNVIEATDGLECMDVLKKTTPDVLILDLIMPNLDGFGVIRKLKVNKRTADIPVIISTAKDLSNEEMKMLEDSTYSILEKKSDPINTTINNIISELRKIELKHFESKINKKNRILIVEDNDAAIVQLQSVLEKEGFIIDVARGGQEALDFVSKSIPDGIILDLMMPEIDGFKVLEEIRSSKQTKDIPVLILSAKTLTSEDLKVLSNNNVSQLLQKGDINEEELIKKTNLMLGKSQSNNKIELPNKNTSKAKVTEGLSEKSSSKSKSKLLVIEDNPDNLTTIGAILKLKYHLIFAETGKKGIELAYKENPDLILLDMMLPEMNGLEILEILRKDERTQNVPIIALTAQAMKGDKERILAAGCDDYLSKPIDPLKLLETVDKWIKS